jgi:hypothetical protein
MSSILKVDTIQTASGGTPTASDLGLNVTGGVLQVVESSYTSVTSVSSGTYVDTGMTVSITPTATSSSIVVMPFMNDLVINGSAKVQVKLFRNIDGGSYTELEEWDALQQYVDNTGGSCTPVYKDTPSTTGVVNYKLQFSLSLGTATVRLNNAVDGGGSSRSNIVLMEIAG